MVCLTTMIGFGEQASRAAANLPQSTTAALFTVSGGRIVMMQILGEVTTVLQNTTNLVQLQANPTAAGASVDLCTNTHTGGDSVGTLYGLSGINGEPLSKGLAIHGQSIPLILQPGSIDLVCGGSITGQVKWDVWYYALDEGASVVAA